MTFSTNLNLQLLKYNQVHKELVANEAFVVIDALLNNAVIDLGINHPPSDSCSGDTYIIGDNPSGEWYNKNQYLTFYYNGWRFIKPKEGLNLWIKNKNNFYLFDGLDWINKFYQVYILAGQETYLLNPQAFRSQYELDITGDCKIIIKDSASSVESVIILLKLQDNNYKIEWSNNVQFMKPLSFGNSSVFLLQLQKIYTTGMWLVVSFS